MREFFTFNDDVERFAEWLIVCGVTAVAMESTGIYEIFPQNKGDAIPLIKYFDMPRPVGVIIHWIPGFEILEAKHFVSWLGLSFGTKVRGGINYG